MARINHFEDLVAWQKARVLTKRIYDVTKTGPLAQDFGLSRQMQRAAVSVMSNIAEGFERSRHAEFHQFLSIAKASCAELRSQIYVAGDVHLLESSLTQSLLEQAQEVGRIIGGLRAAVQQMRDEQGNK